MAKNDPLLLTQAEYARSRKERGLPGGSREAVRKAVDAGRISAFGPDKTIDPGLADKQWAQNTRVRAANDVAPSTDAAPTGPAADLVDQATQDPVPRAPDEPAHSAPTSLSADPGYQEARARQAQAEARTSEYKLAELEGQLVRIDQVRTELASKLSPVREALLQLPSRLAPLIAATTDAARIQTLLEAEIHQVLAPLAGMVASTPATDQAAAA